MKKLLLSFSALMLFLSASAQTYFSEDFESGNLNNWTLIDGDGDNNNWAITTYNPSLGQGKVAYSASWNPPSGTPAGPLHPDNWMISSAIDLSSASGIVYLTWKVYGQHRNYPEENYTVYVATSSDTTSLVGSSTNFTEVLTRSNGYMIRGLDVSSYIGQTIYVGFRHHNVVDKYRMNLDDIAVKKLTYDISLESVNVFDYSEAGDVEIKGTIKNNGPDITSFDVTWNDGSDHTETFNVGIPHGQTYNFTHATQLAVAVGGIYDFTVSVTTANDSDATNNTLNHKISGLSFLPERSVVIEEGTGTWCGWCPRGAVAMETMQNDGQRNHFIGIAVHGGNQGSDPMEVNAYSAGANYPGYPNMNVNRFFKGRSVSTGLMRAYYDLAHQIPTNSSIYIDNVTYDQTTRDWKADVFVKWATKIMDDHRIAIVLVEDGVTGTGSGYNQKNYYHSGQAGALSGAGISNWVGAGNPVPAAQMTYNHVGRELVGGNYNGISGSLTIPAQPNDLNTYSASGTLNSAWDASNVKLVAMVIKQSTGEIMNANETHWSLASVEESTIENVNVYPNPATDVLNVAFEAKNADYTVSLTDLSGRTMVSNTLTSLSGAQSLALPVADLANGNYILTISSEEGTYTQKVVIK